MLGKLQLSPLIALQLTASSIQVLLTEDPKLKAALTHDAFNKFKAGRMPVGSAEPPVQPARPAKPQVQDPLPSKCCATVSVQPASTCHRMYISCHVMTMSQLAVF